jgi:mono/diheme cytochrome c family protein
MSRSRLIWGLGIAFAAIVLVLFIVQRWTVIDTGGVDIEAGRQFAERKCANCHAVGQTGSSPVDTAPPFRTFARKWPLESIEEALAEGMEMNHPSLPTFTLTPREIRDFISYLETIQQ